MKRKLLLIGLSLILVLAGLMPATAAVAKPAVQVVASGFVTGIDPTGENVVPIGDWGWKVTDRSLTGVFSGPKIADEFTFTYDAVVDLTQKGTLWGTLNTGGYTLNAFGKSGSAYLVGCLSLIDGNVYPAEYYNPDYCYPLYAIDVSGAWSVVSGGRGGGKFTATLVFVPSADGAHIAMIIPNYSPITLTGELVPTANWWTWFWKWLWGRRS